MTRIKAISVVAAAVMLTALGASSGFAWNGVTLSAEVVCKDNTVLVHAQDNDSQDLKKHSPGTLSVVDASGTVGSATWTFGSGTDVIAKIDKLHGPGPFQVELDADTSVKSAPFTINCKPACSEQLTFPANTPTSDGTNLSWTIHNSTNSPITFVRFIKEASAHPTLKQETAPATGDVKFNTPLVKDSLTDTLYLSWGGAQVCTAKKVFSVSSSPASSPSASATAEPSATASPSESAAAAASAVPSPPNTGGGSSGGADRSFALVLLALVLGTVGVGGTTLALSRKRS